MDERQHLQRRRDVPMTVEKLRLIEVGQKRRLGAAHHIERGVPDRYR